MTKPKKKKKRKRKERCNLQWSISVELQEIQMKLLPSVGNDVRKFVKKKLLSEGGNAWFLFFSDYSFHIFLSCRFSFSWTYFYLVFTYWLFDMWGRLANDYLGLYLDFFILDSQILWWKVKINSRWVLLIREIFILVRKNYC